MIANLSEPVVCGLQSRGIMHRPLVDKLMRPLSQFVLLVLQVRAATKIVFGQGEKFIVYVREFLSDLIKRLFHCSEVNL